MRPPPPIERMGEIQKVEKGKDSNCEAGEALSGDTIILKGCEIKPIGTSEEGTIVIARIKLPWETSAVVRSITAGYENRFTETHDFEYRSIEYLGVYNHIMKFRVCTVPGAAGIIELVKCLFPRLKTKTLTPRITNEDMTPRINCIRARRG